MLTAEHITVRFGVHTAVDDVSFTLEEGHWLMLVGPNGAGKSTLLRALAQACPYAGRFTADGRDVKRMKPSERARALGFLAQQHTQQYAYTVAEIVRLGRYAHRKGFLAPADPDEEKHVARALALTGLGPMARASVLTLSGGEQQRAFLAQVFAQDPRVLVLDEPVNHLDLQYQQRIFGLVKLWLKRPGRAVLSVVHDLSLARRYGTDILLLDGGRKAAGGPMADFVDGDTLRDVYGLDVEAWMRRLSQPWQPAP
ncbi:MAG: ABC transporter ATP-binding protein [Clostridia bacterium]|nr:ABC transporter ATP-binding protein [Clostridia bacterium]